jgi:predicted Zn-dependent protease
VAQLATEWKQKLNLTNAQVNRNAYLRKIEGLIYGEDPKGGFLENSVFYHPTLKFQFPVPQGWAYQNSPQQVQLASKDGKAMMLLMLAQGASLQEAASAIVQKYKLQLVENRNVNVHGSNAIAMIADLQQQQGNLRTLSYVIEYGGNIYHLIGVSAVNDFNNYSSYFTNTMQNFRTLTDASKLNKKPERVRLKTVSGDASLEQVFRNYKVPEKRFEEFAVLNGMKLNDRVASGTLIKIIEQ